MNRKQRREMMRKIQSEDISLEVVHPDAAGIDIGNESHYVAVVPSRDQQPVRSFGCTTGELKAMADWLKQCGIRTVATTGAPSRSEHSDTATPDKCRSRAAVPMVRPSPQSDDNYQSDRSDARGAGRPASRARILPRRRKQRRGHGFIRLWQRQYACQLQRHLDCTREYRRQHRPVHAHLEFCAIRLRDNRPGP